MKAKAVVFTGPNEVEIQSVECPDPNSKSIVVKTTHSWISNGTEGSFLRGERIQGEVPYKPGYPWPFPIVAGYQKIGVVEWVGKEVTDIEIGETIFSTVGLVSGMFEAAGGQISPSVGPRALSWKLPEDNRINPLAYSGLVLTQVGVNCGTRPPVSDGEGAIVVGDGMVGHWAAQTLAWRGAEVVLIGRHTYRLEKFGNREKRHLVNQKEGDWEEKVRELLPRGAQVLVDTVGSIESIKSLLPEMKKHGHIVSAGFYGEDDGLPLQMLRTRELNIELVSGWSQVNMDLTVDLIHKGHIETLPLITHRFPVDRAAEAWKLIESKSEPVLGVILDW